jgi:hypothetical protein
MAQGALYIQIVNGYNLIVDSNVQSPPTYAPRAAFIGAQYCNFGTQPLTNVTAYAGDYDAGRSLTVGTTSASTTVTNATFATTDVGYSISGFGIPAGATIVSVTAGVSAVISAPATSTGSITARLDRKTVVGITSGSKTVTSSNAFTAADAGLRISGTGIPTGTTITSFISTSQVTISQAATATNAALTARLYNAAGIFPVKTFGADALRPHLANTGDYSINLEVGTGTIEDATRYIGTLAVNECRIQYWLIGYPACVNQGTPRTSDQPPCTATITGGVGPEDDLSLDYDLWATADGVADKSVTRSFTMRNEISAAANKIWPNTASKVPDEYLSAIQDVIGWGTIGPDGQPLTDSTAIYPGQRVITTQGIWYDLGNVNHGFDNNGDLVPDVNAWMQPVGDAGAFDSACFRMINVYGIVIVKLVTGGELLIPMQNLLYHENLPDNTGVVGLIYYQFVATKEGCSSSMTPYQEAASGFDNEKFAGDYGLNLGLVSGAFDTDLSFVKTDNTSIVAAGGTLSYELTLTNKTGVPLGAPELGTPLVLRETIPTGTTFVAGSADDSPNTNLTEPIGSGSYVQGYTEIGGTLQYCRVDYQFSTPAAYTLFYSTDNGATWSITEPSSGVTDIRWMLQATLSLDGGPSNRVCNPTNGVFDNGTLQVSIPSDSVLAGTTSGSSTVTAIKGIFYAGDVGRGISGVGIPAGATIATFVDASTVTISANATATTTTGVVAPIARTGSSLAVRFQVTVNSVGTTSPVICNTGYVGFGPVQSNTTASDCTLVSGINNIAGVVWEDDGGTGGTHGNGTIDGQTEVGIGSGAIVSLYYDANADGEVDSADLLYTSTTTSAYRSQPTVGTTTGTATLTSTSFQTTDIGSRVYGTNIPAGAYIIAVSPGVSATMSANATATGSVTATITGGAYNFQNVPDGNFLVVVKKYDGVSVAGVTTNASTTVTSAGLFTSGDVGRTISGPGIPVGTTVASFTNSSTVTLSAAATATGNVSLVIDRTDGAVNAVNDFLASRSTDANTTQGWGNTTFDPNVALTTDSGILKLNEDLTTATLAISIDLDHSNASNEAATTTALRQINFGFAPPFQLTKSTLATTVDEGDTFDYTIVLENRLPSVGVQGPTGCQYTAWATTGTNGSTSTKEFTNHNNVFDGPNRKVATGVVTGGGNREITGTGFRLASQAGSVTRVEALFMGYYNVALDDDYLSLKMQYNSGGYGALDSIPTGAIDSFIGPPATLDPNSAISWDVTSQRAWSMSDNFALAEFYINPKKAAGADGKIFSLDAIGIRVTTNADCEAGPSTTLTPVPLQDRFDSTTVAFVSADPAPTLVSGSTIQWDDVGPILPGTSNTVTVTMRALDVAGLVTGKCSGVASTLTNTGTTATFTSSVAHSLVTGQPVTISGATSDTTLWNGTFTATVTSPTTFTYTMTGTPGTSPATGAVIFQTVGTGIAAISSATRSGTTATITTTATHYLTTGQSVTISGATSDTTLWNGTFTITVTGANTFTYTMSGTPGTSPATGTMSLSAAPAANSVCNLAETAYGGKNVYYADGRKANDDDDKVAINIQGRGELRGTVFRDGDNDGWAMEVAGTDPRLANISLTLFGCVQADGVTMETGTSNSKDCSAMTGGNTWTALSTTTTASDGTYEFIGLNSGYYIIQVGDTDSVVTTSGSSPFGFTQTAEPLDVQTSTSGAANGADCGTCNNTWGTSTANLRSDQTTINFLNGALEETITGIDFGYFSTQALIYGKIYHDKDGDGAVREAEDTDLDDFTVRLYTDPNGDGDPADGVLQSTTTSDSNGDYSFTVNPGVSTNYTIVVTPETLPNNVWSETRETTGGTGSLDNRIPITVAPGATSGSHDFGYTLTTTSTIGDTVFLDFDGDGVQDTTESGISDITVWLYEDLDRDGSIDSGIDLLIQTDVTDSTGKYLFTGLAEGSYIVVVDTDDSDFPTNTTQTADPDIYSGTIGDMLWLDADGDAVLDAGEGGVVGTTVLLWSDNGNGTFSSSTDTLVAATVTNVNGNYRFTGLPAGSYFIQVDETTLPYSALVRTSADPTATLITLATNSSSYLTADSGYSPSSNSAIGDRVWHDVDGDGVQDAGEVGISGVDITVTGTGCAPCTATTSASGFWYVPGLTANAIYTIAIDTTDLPRNFVATNAPVASRAIAVTTTNGSATVTSAALFTNLDLGRPISGTGFPAGAYIIAVNSSSSVTISANATASGSPTATLAATRTAGTFDNMNVDFGYRFSPTATGTISGSVFLDADGDAAFDSGEQMSGIIVNLLDEDGYVVATTTTSSGTARSFTVTTSNGSATVTSAALFLATDVGSLITGTNIPDGSYITGFTSTSSVTISNNATANGSTTASLSPYGFPGTFIGNYSIEALSSFGTRYSSVFLASTTGFPNLNVIYDSTIYTTADDMSSVSVDGVHSNLLQDFGYQRYLGSVGDTVYWDANENGTQDLGEPGISGVTVELYDCAWTDDGDGAFEGATEGTSCSAILGTATTTADDPGTVSDESGKYLFANLDELATNRYYVIRVITSSLPGTFGAKNGVGVTTYLTADPETDGAVCTNLTGSTDPQSTVCESQNMVQVFRDGLNYTGGDFGYNITNLANYGKFGDYVWIDSNANGLRDSGEAGIAGITVWLDADSDGLVDWTDSNGNGIWDTADGGERWTQTDADGYYLFTGMATGSYNVKVRNGTQSVTSLTRVGTLATVTSTAHGLATGQLVTIAGATSDPTLWNGTFVVTVTGANTFTYTMSGTPVTSPATGATITLRDGDWPTGMLTTPTFQVRCPTGLFPTTGTPCATDSGTGTPNLAVVTVNASGKVSSITDGAGGTTAGCPDCDLNVDFGYRYVVTGNKLEGTVCIESEVSGTTFGNCGATDTTRSGVSGTETALAGVTVSLYTWVDAGTADTAWNATTGVLDSGDTFTFLGSTSTGANGDYSFANVPDDVIVVLGVNATQNLRLNTTNTNSSVEDSNVLKRQVYDGYVDTNNNGVKDLTEVTVMVRQALEELTLDADDDVRDLDFAFSSTLGGTIIKDFGDLPDTGSPTKSATNYHATLLSGGASHRVRSDIKVNTTLNSAVVSSGSFTSSDVGSPIVLSGLFPAGTAVRSVSIPGDAAGTRSVTSVSRTGNTATATATSHNLVTGDMVTMTGATDSTYWNGTFTVTFLTTNTFSYTMIGTPAAGSPTGTMSFTPPSASLSDSALATNTGATVATVKMGWFFGAAVTNETNGLQDANAAGDADDGIDLMREASGIAKLIPGNYATGCTPNDTDPERECKGGIATITASGEGWITGWMDFNQDGDFDDTGERIINQALTRFQGSQSVTSLTRVTTTATVTTPVAHGLSAGQQIIVSGATSDANLWNGTFTITAATSTTFDYTMAGTPATSPATGTISYSTDLGLTQFIPFNVPTNVASIMLDPTKVFTRFRIYPSEPVLPTSTGAAQDVRSVGAGASVYGAAGDVSLPVQGEVSDYMFSVTLATTRADVTAFVARDMGGSVALEWETTSERGTVGFFLNRWDERQQSFVRVNQRLIPSLLTPHGGLYRYIDPAASVGQNYRYELIEVEASGKRNTKGPYDVNTTVTMQADAAFQREQSIEPDPRSTGFAMAARVGRVRAEQSGDARRSNELRNNTRAAAGAKISITESGIHYVSLQDVQTRAGFTVDRTWLTSNKNLYALTNRGDVVPFASAPDNNGLLFYGQALNSSFARDNVYWLGASERNSPRMKERKDLPTRPPTGGESFTRTLHFEQDNQPAPGLVTDADKDFWFWNSLFSWDPALAFTFRTDGATRSGSASMVIRLKGGSETETDPDHHAVLRLNGQNIGDMTWDGLQDVERTIEFSASILVDGENTLELENVADTGAEYSLIYLDSFDVQFGSFYRAIDNRAEVSTAANASVLISGFTRSDVMVFDITNPKEPVRVIASLVQQTGGRYGVALSPKAANTVYYAVAGDAFRSASGIVKDVASTLKTRNNRAEYIIVTNQDMSEAARGLADYRSDLTSKVVDIEDVYDEFNYGIPDPHALRSFLGYAYSEWSQRPKYVLLGGDGTWDYKNSLGLGNGAIQPMMISTPSGIFPSDVWFANVEKGPAPEMAIGRLPVSTPEELTQMITKIQAREAASGVWMNRALMAADAPDKAGDFPVSSAQIAASLPAGSDVTPISVAELGGDEARTQFINVINEGVGIVNYIGHGGYWLLSNQGMFWAGDEQLLTNSERLPIMTAMTCTMANFGLPWIASVGELLVTKADGGVAALWAPTGESENALAVPLAQSFYSSSSVTGPRTRIGDAIMASMKAYELSRSADYMLGIYTLLGDPAMRLR